MAIPSFFLGIILTYIFGLVLKWFQPGKFVQLDESFSGCVRYLIFPAIAVALPKIAMVVKFLRNSVLSEMGQDYVRTAYSRATMTGAVLYRHVLKNAFIPVVTFMALIIAEILGGQHHCRAGVFRAGCGQTADHRHLRPGLSGGAGHCHLCDGIGGDHQFPGGCCVSAHRSAGAHGSLGGT